MKRILLLCILICCGWVETNLAAVANPTDISSLVTVYKTGLTFNRSNNTFYTTVTLTNTSTIPIIGPITLTVIINNPSQVSLVDASGVSSAGYPTLTVHPPNNILSPGNSINNIILNFSNPNQIKFSYNLLIDQYVTPSFDTTVMYSQQVASVGNQLQMPITVNPVSDSGNIIIAATNLPSGASLSASSEQSNGQWTATMTWTPALAQLGNNPVTFSAQDSISGIVADYTVNFTVLANASVINRILAARPKLMTVGNSINGFNAIRGGTNGQYWGADGHLTWFHAKTQAGFDRAKSTSNSWSDGAYLDSLGCYFFGGAVLNQQGSNSILNHLPQAMSLLIDTPDIVYLDNLVENDLAQGYAPAVIESAITETINLVQTQWPNALIIIATPSPSFSYNTNTLHSNVATISAFIKNLPNTFNNLLVENNVSTIFPGTADQPNYSYVVDAIHPNERGALVRANGLYAQYGWLFPYELQIPTTSYSSTNPALGFQYNPAFAATGGVSQNPATVAGLTYDFNYTSYEFFLDNNYTSTISQIPNNGGLNVTLGAAGAVGSELGFTFGSAYGSIGYYSGLPVVNPVNTYYGVMKVKVVNPTNLFGFGFHSVFSGGTVNTVYAINFQGGFSGKHPEGLSDIFKAGDTFTFITPPTIPGTANVNVVDYGFVYGTQFMVPGKGVTNPAVQIMEQNVINMAP